MQKMTHLVTHHVEALSSDILESFPQIVKDVIGRWPGIYALYNEGKLYYVGLATKLVERFPSHLKDKHAGKWDSFSLYLTKGEEFIKDLETLILHIHQPPGNANRMNFKHSVNLFRAIDKTVQAIQYNQRWAFWGKDRSKPIIIRIGDKPKKGRQSTLAPYVSEGLLPYASKGFLIRMFFKGKRYIARVGKDGHITFHHKSAGYSRLKGKIFTSPSSAASAVSGHAMDGWTWWSYEHGKGHWVPLDKLRNQ